MLVRYKYKNITSHYMRGKKNALCTNYQNTVHNYNQFTISEKKKKNNNNTKTYHKNPTHQQNNNNNTTLPSGKHKIKSKVNQDKANIKV